MSDHQLTVTVPSALYDRLKQRAAQRQRSLEDEVVLALAATVPSEAEEMADLDATLASLTMQDDATLWQMAKSRVPVADAARLAELADKRQREGLTEPELEESAVLVQLHDRVMVVRAQAALLLKERGHDIARLRQAK
jgi:plasmid stability protein